MKWWILANILFGGLNMVIGLSSASPVNFVVGVLNFATAAWIASS